MKDFKTFKKEVEELLVEGGQPYVCYGHKPKQDFIYVSWETHGAEGGNCWGDDAREYISHEVVEPELTYLDDILKKYVPNISYLDYKELASKIIEEDEYTDNEYYGNYTCYGIKGFNLRKLYNIFVEKGWLN